MEPYRVVDLAIVLILGIFLYLGVRRGFLAGMADLVGMAFAFVVAVKGYPLVSGWLADFAGVPRIMVNFLILMGLFLLAEWLFTLVTAPLLGLVGRFLRVGPLRLVDSLAGLLPGLIKGLLVATALVAFFALFPLNADLREGVRLSTVGGRLYDAASVAAPRLEAYFGGSLHDTALFITQPTEEHAARRMNFPSGLATREDPAAEQRMLALVNEERVKAGLKPLVLDQRLQAAATAHSVDMFRQNYFAHESPNGDSPADRLRKVGIPYMVMGENLAYAPSVEVAHTGLMNSPSHRRNILSPSFSRIGIGVVDGGLYGKMFSQEFTN